MKNILRTILRHPFTLAGIVYLLANGVSFMSREDSEWEDVFVLAARRLRAGLDIYQLVPESRMHAFSYPPLQAMLAIPFTLLSKQASRFIWMLVNWLAAFFFWRFSWKSSGGKKLEGNARPDRAEMAICILGLICAARFVEDCLDHQQTDLVIGALLMAGVLAWQRSRSFLAAGLWGISAAFKGPPLLLAPYLAWRGRWLAAIWMLVLAVGLNLLPDLVHPAPHGIWLQQWYVQMIQPVPQIGVWHSAPENNQSIAGEAFRRFGQTVAPRNLKIAVYGLEALLVAATGLSMGRFFKPPPNPTIAAVESAAVMALFLLLSPMSSKPHFCILLLAGFILAREVILRKSFAALFWMVLAIVMFDLMDRNVLGKAVGAFAMDHGAVMWGTIAIGAGCVTIIRREKPIPANPPPAPPRR